jgi:flavin reductase (DIM6/NTAB) family NADH-FMN oxidoreductase RutF
MFEEVPLKKCWMRKYPEAVTLAVTLKPSGEPNVIALGWAMPASFDPPLCVISVGHTRYSHECLEKHPEFVLAFPTEEQHAAALFCGSHSGREMDKLAACGLKTLPAKHVKPPLLDGCSTNLECRVVASFPAGDHTLFVGQILAAHVDRAAPGRLYGLGGNGFGGVRPVEKTQLKR